MTAPGVVGAPPGTSQLDITESPSDLVRVYLATPREWGHGGTARKVAERKWLEEELELIRRWRPWATILHDGCPTGGPAITEQTWARAFGLPTEVFAPAWAAPCGPKCEPGCRRQRAASDEVHGDGPDYCHAADVRTAARLFHPESSKRPDKVVAVYGTYSRVTRAIARLAEQAGIPTKRIKHQ